VVTVSLPIVICRRLVGLCLGAMLQAWLFRRVAYGPLCFALPGLILCLLIRLGNLVLLDDGRLGVQIMAFQILTPGITIMSLLAALVCMRRRSDPRVQPAAVMPVSVPSSTIGNLLRSSSVVPVDSLDFDDVSGASTDGTQHSIPSLGTFETSPPTANSIPRSPDDVQKLRQEIADGILALSLCTDSDDFLQFQWRAVQDMLNSILLCVVELQGAFQFSLEEGAYFDEARVLIHAALAFEGYCEGASCCLSTFCDAQFWHKWEQVLTDLCVHGVDGGLVFRATAHEAAKLTVAQIKNQIYKTRNIKVQWQRLHAHGGELDNDDDVHCLRTLTLVVDLGPFTDMAGTWELIQRPNVYMHEHLHQITIHAGGCTDNDGRMRNLEVALNHRQLLLDGRPLQLVGRILHYIPSSGVSHCFRRLGEQA